MEVKVEKTNPVQAKLKIQVPAEIVNEKINSYFGALANRAKIPGFRPGKAPRDVVKRMYAQDSASDLSERIISESVLQAVKTHKLQLVMPPLLLATDLPEENKAFNFEVEVDLKPEVPSIDFSKVKFEAPAETEASQVRDEEINERLKYLREKDATFSDLSTPRPVQDGDCVIISFRGTVDGEEKPGMSAENQTLVLGRNQFIPEFETAVLGMEIGGTKKAPVKFPDNYQAEDLAGKTAEFQIDLVSIKQKNIAELNDEFAKSVDSSVQNVEELKTKMRAEMSEQKNRKYKDDIRNKLGDALAEQFAFPVSSRQVASMAERVAQETHQMMHQMGVEHEENEEHAKSLLDASVKKAERDIRLSYILEKIAKEEKLEVNKEDIDRRIDQTAAKTGISVAQIRSYYAGKDEDSTISRMERLRIDILDEKSLDYALSKATIKIKGGSN